MNNYLENRKNNFDTINFVKIVFKKLCSHSF